MFLMFYHLLSHIYHPCFRIFSVFYFIIILVPNFLCDSCNSFVLQIDFTKNNPLCNDPQFFWQCKCFFVTVTIAVNSPHYTLYFVILSCVCFSTHLNEDVNEIFDCPHAGFSVLVENIITKEVLMINTWI